MLRIGVEQGTIIITVLIVIGGCGNKRMPRDLHS